MARIIYLGNAAVHPDINRDTHRPDVDAAEPPAESVTVVHPAADSTLFDVLSDVANLWRVHSTENPSWVASDDDRVADMLSAQFDGCPVLTVSDAETEYAAVAAGGNDHEN